MPIGNGARIGARGRSHRARHRQDPRDGAEHRLPSGEKSAARPAVNWGVDKKYGGSGGFQFGSTAKAFALVTALENGMPINANVNAKLASTNQAASYTPSEIGEGCVPGGPTGRSATTSAIGGRPMTLRGDGPVDQHGVHRAAGRSAAARCRRR